MTNTSSIQTSVNSAVIGLGRQREQQDRVVAILAGAIALLDPERNGCAVSLLEMATDEVADFANLNHARDALEGVKAVIARS